VVQAPQTDARTLDLLTRWVLGLGKTPVRVKDSPGFVVNRVLMPYVNEAVLLVTEGLRVDTVDGLMRRFGMPMGPLEMLDQVGLDVAAHIADGMQPAFGERYAPNPAFRRMSQSGWLGQKTGAGFYRHRGKKRRVNKDVLPLLRSETPLTVEAIKGLPKAVRLQQARDRMVLLMVNEAAACLGEGLAESPQVIDLAVVLGTGWAPHRGGPLHHADAYGLARVVDALKDYAHRFGPHFEPCEELQPRPAENRPFHPAEFCPGAGGADIPVCLALAAGQKGMSAPPQRVSTRASPLAVRHQHHLAAPVQIVMAPEDTIRAGDFVT